MKISATTGVRALEMLSTKGLKIINASGSPVFLRGVNLGSLFLIEPWMIGMGDVHNQGDQALDHQGIIDILVRRFGNADLLRFFETQFISERDFDALAQLGATVVRLPFYFRTVESENGDFAHFDNLDFIVNGLAKRGIYTILDLHGAPGGQSVEFHTGQTGKNKLFDNSSEGEMFRATTITLWQALADHYRHNGSVAGYGLLNEPYVAQEKNFGLSQMMKLWSFCDELYTAIRYVDPNHIIFIPSIPTDNKWLLLPKPMKFGWQNIVYEMHYYGFDFNNKGIIQGVLPAQKHHAYVQRKLKQARDNEYQIPIFVGEFNGFSDPKNWLDYLEGFEQRGWHYTIWSYKNADMHSNWGIYTSSAQGTDALDFNVDSIDVIKNKMKNYNSANYSLNPLFEGILPRYWHRDRQQ